MYDSVFFLKEEMSKGNNIAIVHVYKKKMFKVQANNIAIVHIYL